MYSGDLNGDSIADVVISGDGLINGTWTNRLLLIHGKSSNDPSFPAHTWTDSQENDVALRNEEYVTITLSESVRSSFGQTLDIQGFWHFFLTTYILQFKGYIFSFHQIW